MVCKPREGKPPYEVGKAVALPHLLRVNPTRRLHFAYHIAIDIRTERPTNLGLVARLITEDQINRRLAGEFVRQL